MENSFKIKRKERILAVIIIATIMFIWGNSMLPATVSGGASEKLKEIFNLTAGNVSGLVMQSDHLLRKLGHFSEYLILGLEMTLMLRFYKGKTFSSVFLAGGFTALSDETIQLFSAGRSSEVRDVWIDLAGFAAGTFILLLVRKIRANRLSAGQ